MNSCCKRELPVILCLIFLLSAFCCVCRFLLENALEAERKHH